MFLAQSHKGTKARRRAARLVILNRIERGIFKAILTPLSLILRPAKPRSRALRRKHAVVDFSGMGASGGYAGHCWKSTGRRIGTGIPLR
jgi:hypothetical protein